MPVTSTSCACSWSATSHFLEPGGLAIQLGTTAVGFMSPPNPAFRRPPPLSSTTTPDPPVIICHSPFSSYSCLSLVK
ncbi:Os01g0269950 [Oryza sativa Japonica Group]|uniref:Os01g0269950 protein n=1 Tax=Oryza sativa subsp. japonica TaxID=39947 RepID=A0A0P0V0W4_ORYSJ|nr:hypothetical protein EE612_001694 [Oryza sativa]BAS71498.1 Os01g0269950 [Oryza sativa Japonica Group]